MQILDYDSERYFAAEGDLCQAHRVSEDDVRIETELSRLQGRLAKAYPRLKKDRDYEFPDWHHHIRMFWTYLYSDAFYTEDFIPRVQEFLRSTDRSYFAQFECYSPSLESPDLPSGYVGQFLLFKDTVMFCKGESWPAFKIKLNVK